MHPFSTNPDLSARLGVLWALLAICLWSVSQPLVSLVGADSWWVGPPSVLGWYALLRLAYDRWLWATRPFQWLGFAAPDISGLWHASVESSHDGGIHGHGMEVTIRQTGTRIGIHFTAEHSTSWSTVASFSAHEAQGPTWRYWYQNEPSVGAVPTMHGHRGAVELVLDLKAGTLKGAYFSGRDRGTHGDLTLHRRPRLNGSADD